MISENHYVSIGGVSIYTEIIKSENYDKNKVCILVSGAIPVSGTRY